MPWILENTKQQQYPHVRRRVELRRDEKARSDNITRHRTSTPLHPLATSTVRRNQTVYCYPEGRRRIHQLFLGRRRRRRTLIHKISVPVLYCAAYYRKLQGDANRFGATSRNRKGQLQPQPLPQPQLPPSPQNSTSALDSFAYHQRNPSQDKP